MLILGELLGLRLGVGRLGLLLLILVSTGLGVRLRLGFRCRLRARLGFRGRLRVSLGFRVRLLRLWDLVGLGDLWILSFSWEISGALLPRDSSAVTCSWT